MTTVANQKVIHICKSKCVKDFLQIKNNEWLEAQAILTPSAFVLYLYLSSNADGFDLALSQKAFEDATGIKKTTYHKAVALLVDEGYLQLKQGNIYNFFTNPVPKSELNKSDLVPKNEQSCSQKGYTGFLKVNKVVPKSDREIDKHIITYKIDSPSSNEKGEKQKAIEQLAAKGFAEEWIDAALNGKPQTTWDRYGYGLLFNADYQKEITESLNKLKANKDRIAQQFASIQNQKVMAVTINPNKNKPKKQLMDLTELYDDIAEA